MDIEQCLDSFPGPVIIHRGEVFFNTRDGLLAAEWKKRGARVLDWYDGELRPAPKRTCAMGWEVHPLRAIDQRVIINVEGDEVDITRETLLEAARTR